MKFIRRAVCVFLFLFVALPLCVISALLIRMGEGLNEFTDDVARACDWLDSDMGKAIDRFVLKLIGEDDDTHV